MATAGALGFAAAAAVRGTAFSAPGPWSAVSRGGLASATAHSEGTPLMAQPSQQQACTDIAACAAAVVMAAGLAHSASRSRRHAAAVASSGKRTTRVTRACSLEYGEDLAVPDDAFVVLGLAHCFEQVEGGKLKDVWVLEPVSASTVEVVDNGASTSYEAFMGTTAGQMLAQDIGALPTDLFCGHEAQWCSDLVFRTGCSTRTWMRDHARDVVRKLVPVGEVRSGFNTSTEHKRILNFVNEVNDSDNIKQDMSIDVYGREDEENESKDGVDSQIADLYNV